MKAANPSPHDVANSPAWERFAPHISFTLGLVACVPLFVATKDGGFPLDDAWTHMVYGRELARSGTLGYNAGIPATGSTSPLWAALLGLAHLVLGASGSGASSLGVVRAAKLVGALSHASAACFAAIALRDVSRSAIRTGHDAMPLLAGSAIALSPTLAFAANSGMEASLAGTLALSSLVLLSRERLMIATALAALATLARPECLILVAPLAIHAYRTMPRESRTRCVLSVIGAALPMTGWFARNALVAGEPLPATFYAKQHIIRDGVLRDGLTYLLSGVLSVEPLSVLLLAASASGLVYFGLGNNRLRLQSPLVLSTSIFGFAYLAATAMLMPHEDPTAYYFVRYAVPAVPALLVAGFASLGLVRAFFDEPNKRLGARIMLSLAATALLLDVAAYRSTLTSFTAQVRNIDEVQVRVGRAIASETSRDASVWTVDAGAVRYFGDRRTVDLAGLNTRTLTRSGVIPTSWNANYIASLPFVTRIESASPLATLLVARTRHYEVTRFEAMGEQRLLECLYDGGVTTTVALTETILRGSCTQARLPRGD